MIALASALLSRAGAIIPPWVKFAVPTLLVLAIFVQGQRMHAWKMTAKANEQTILRIGDEQKRQNERVVAWAKDIELKSKDIADNADRNYQAGIVAASDAAERYIASHRVQPSSNRGCAVTAATSAETDRTQSGNGPGPVSELVTITPDDVRVCTVNTQRLKAVHDWAIDLQGR